MGIDTTLNIHKTIMIKINHASDETGKSRNYIIATLLKRAMTDSRQLLTLNQSVKYQERDPLKKWHCFHVSYREDVYEFCQDMRKFYKLSVSRILAFSVGKYLEKLINELANETLAEYTDNYPFSGYIFIQESLDGAILWKLTWGIPTNLKKLFPPG